MRLLSQQGWGLCHIPLVWMGFLGAGRTGQNLRVQNALQGITPVPDWIDIRGLNPLFYCVLPYPDDLLALVFSDHAGRFHFLTNVQQKLRPLPFMIHLILILIMGRNGDSRDISMIVPSRGDYDSSNLGYFARTFSQKRTALSFDWTLFLIKA
jgi:hypothetical protein